MIYKSVARQIKQINRLAIRGAGTLIDTFVIIDALLLIHQAEIESINDNCAKYLFAPNVFSYIPEGLKMIWSQNGHDGEIIITLPDTEEDRTLIWKKGEHQGTTEATPEKLLFYLDVVFGDYFERT